MESVCSDTPFSVFGHRLNVICQIVSSAPDFLEPLTTWDRLRQAWRASSRDGGGATASLGG